MGILCERRGRCGGRVQRSFDVAIWAWSVLTSVWSTHFFHAAHAPNYRPIFSSTLRVARPPTPPLLAAVWPPQALARLSPPLLPLRP